MIIHSCDFTRKNRLLALCFVLIVDSVLCINVSLFGKCGVDYLKFDCKASHEMED